MTEPNPQPPEQTQTEGTSEVITLARAIVFGSLVKDRGSSPETVQACIAEAVSIVGSLTD